MKRTYILGTMMLMLAVAVSAQEEKKVPYFQDNTFLSAGIGLGGYNNEEFTVGQNAGFQWELMAGKWITNAAAIRLDFSGLGAKGSGDVSRTYLNAHVDFVWDPVLSFSSTPSERAITVYPYIGFGVTYAGKTKTLGRDADYTYHLGLQGNYRFSDALSVYAALKALFIPYSFDNNAGGSQQYAFTAGVNYDLNHDAYRRRLSTESAGIGDDWFFGAAVGFNDLRYRKHTAGHYYVPAIDVEVGKYFSPLWSFKVEYNGFRSKFEGKDFNFMDVHADIVLNLGFIELPSEMLDVLFSTFHYIPTPHESRHWSTSLYAGCGFYNSDYSERYTGSANLGVIVRYKVGKNSDIYANARYISVPPRVFESVENQHSLSTGVRSITLGYRYNLFGRVKRY